MNPSVNFSLINIDPILPFLRSAHGVLVIVATIISMILVVGIIYVLTRLSELKTKEAHVLRKQFTSFGGEAKTMSGRWKGIEEYISSNTVSDWKIAILEADAMLEEVVEKMGYYGDTLGEKLKNVDPRSFPFLDTAWEAHKYRNEIAHGRDLDLSRSEAERIIKLFETVFRGVGEI